MKQLTLVLALIAMSGSALADRVFDPTQPYVNPAIGEADTRNKEITSLTPVTPPGPEPEAPVAVRSTHTNIVISSDLTTIIDIGTTIFYWQFEPYPGFPNTYCNVQWFQDSDYLSEPEMTLRAYHEGELIFENTFDAPRFSDCEANLQLGAYGGTLFNCTTEFQLIIDYVETDDADIVVDRRLYRPLDPDLDCSFTGIPVPYIAN